MTYAYIGAMVVFNKPFVSTTTMVSVSCESCKNDDVESGHAFCSKCGSAVTTKETTEKDTFYTSFNITNAVFDKLGDEDLFSSFDDDFFPPEYSSAMISRHAEDYFSETDTDEVYATVNIMDAISSMDEKLASFRKRFEPYAKVFDDAGVQYEIIYGTTTYEK